MSGFGEAMAGMTALVFAGCVGLLMFCWATLFPAIGVLWLLGALS